MNSKKILSLILSFILTWSLFLPSSAPAADSTSFNPVPISVQAEAPGVPVGTIIAWPVETNPADWDKWLECTGELIDPVVFPELRALVGPQLPNYQGMFLRGHGGQLHSQVNGSTVGLTSTTHQSGNLGGVQGDAIRNIYGRFSGALDLGPSALFINENPGFEYQAGNHHRKGYYTMDVSRVVPTAAENRPANVAVRYLIRALR